MFKRIVFSAAGAGLAVGLLVAALQHVTTTRLIIEAEVFETASAPQLLHRASVEAVSLPLVLAHGPGETAGHHDADAAWAPEDGLERTLYTGLTTILAAIGFGLMLIAAMVLKGGRIDGRTGAVWGACGFAAVALAPALGLPPELPGSAAADLAARQLWWGGTAAATAAGIAILAFCRPAWWKVLAIGLIAAPHLVGAPHPVAYASAAPAELAGHFAAASLVVGAVFWVSLGWAVATLFERLASAGESAEA